MDKSFHHTSEFEKLDDFQVFVSEQKGPWAKLEKLVEQFVEKEIVIEKYRSKRTAIERFTLDVTTSALTARGMYLTEKARGREIVALKENIEALDKAHKAFARALPIPKNEELSVQFRHHIEAVKHAIDAARATVPVPSQLQARNFKNTDIFKHTFVRNLGVCWKKTLVRSPLLATRALSLNLFRRAL
jgi:hypothetical protein